MGSNSLRDQRDARLLRRRRQRYGFSEGCGSEVGSRCRPLGGERPLPLPREDGDGGQHASARTSAAVAETAADRGANFEDDDESDGIEDYTTAYAAIRRKYGQNSLDKMTEGRSSNGMARAFALKSHHKCHRMELKSKQALGVKLIRQRWKSKMNVGNTALVAEDESNHLPKSPNPKLVFRRTDMDYSSARRYQNVEFLNAQTIVAVDSCGDLDIIGLSSLGRLCYEESNCGDTHHGDASSHGAGVHLARMPLSPALTGSSRISLSDCHLELYGYRNGEKFAVGLPSGQVHLFSPERTDAHGGPGSKAPPASANAVWSCLSLPGPRRRYARSDQIPLARMLSLGGKAALLESISDCTTFEEISGWDCGGSSFTRASFSGGAPWAFREGGVGGCSGTALVAAFIDPESDCFSVRTIDERVGGSGGGQLGSEEYGKSSSALVFVDTSTSLAGKCTAADKARSICFSGEHGLVTAHVCVHGNDEQQALIKWWDHRMLYQPVNAINAANLVFPRDDVAGVLPTSEYAINRSFCRKDRTECDGCESCHRRPVSLCPSNDDENHLSHRWSPKALSLIGSKDSSDRFAVSLFGRGHCHHVHIVDSPHRQVVQSIHRGVPHKVLPCFSSNLDFMACHEKRGDKSEAKDCVSIYDISRHNPIHANNILGKKRKVDDAHGASMAGESCLVGSMHPEFKDLYGIDSALTSMAMDEFGCSIVSGTNDCDIFILQMQ